MLLAGLFIKGKTHKPPKQVNNRMSKQMVRLPAAPVAGATAGDRAGDA